MVLKEKKWATVAQVIQSLDEMKSVSVLLPDEVVYEFFPRERMNRQLKTEWRCRGSAYLQGRQDSADKAAEATLVIHNPNTPEAWVGLELDTR